MTIIYPSPIFGPVHSRRLGVSLGINLMPADGKLCTFNCIYCECGFNEDFRPKLLPSQVATPDARRSTCRPRSPLAGHAAERSRARRADLCRQW